MSVTFSYHSLVLTSDPLIFSCFPSVDPMGDDCPGSGIKCVYMCGTHELSIPICPIDKSEHCFCPPYLYFNLLPALHVDAKSKCFIEVDSEMKGFFGTADPACFALE